MVLMFVLTSRLWDERVSASQGSNKVRIFHQLYLSLHRYLRYTSAPAKRRIRALVDSSDKHTEPASKPCFGEELEILFHLFGALCQCVL